MRIAFIGQKGIPAEWGGVETHVEAVAKRLARRGHEVTVYQRAWYVAPGTEVDGVRLVWLPTARSKHADAAWHSALGATHALFERADVAHFHALGPSLFSFVPRLGRAAVVVTVHGLDYGRDKWGAFARAALRLGERMAIRHADELVVVSRALAAHFAERGIVAHVVPNGVEPAAESFVEPPFGLPHAGYLLSLGRWEPNRRLVELVRAYRSLGVPGVKLVIAGADSDAGSYGRAVAAVAAGAPNVICPGWVSGPAKPALLAGALGVVSASSHEGLPIAPLEAMAHGRPCLLSDIGPHRELVGESGAAVLAPMRDEAELGRALEAFLALPGERRDALGCAGRELVQREYSWDRATDELERIYAMARDARARS